MFLLKRLPLRGKLAAKRTDEGRTLPYYPPVSYTHLLHEQGTKFTGIVGFRNKDLVILEDEFRACCDEFIIMTR